MTLEVIPINIFKSQMTKLQWELFMFTTPIAIIVQSLDPDILYKDISMYVYNHHIRKCTFISYTFLLFFESAR